MSQKSYDKSPTLYLIPTPIGNMEDITLRAIKTLENVEVVFAEDTRETGLLLKHLNIKKKLISNHNFNEDKNLDKLIDYLKRGYNVGVVSDRGTPGISDPGYGLAKHAIKNNYNVVSLPGATALIPALTSSGIDNSTFLFYGFLNSKNTKQIKELEELKNIKSTLIFYESPHRIEKTIENIKKILGNREISISREISKKFEEIYRGDCNTILIQLKEPKGEFVIVIAGNTTKEKSEFSINEQIDELIDVGYDKMEAIKEVSKKNKIPKSEVYANYIKKGDTEWN